MDLEELEMLNFREREKVGTRCEVAKLSASVER